MRQRGYRRERTDKGRAQFPKLGLVPEGSFCVCWRGVSLALRRAEPVAVLESSRSEDSS